MSFGEWAYLLSAGLVAIGCVSVVYLWTRASSYFWKRAPDRTLRGLWDNQNFLLSIGLALASLTVAGGAFLRGVEIVGWPAFLVPHIPTLLPATMFLLFLAKVFKSRAGAYDPLTGQMHLTWHMFVGASAAWAIAVTLWGILS